MIRADWEEAHTHYEAALAMIREVGSDHRAEGMILGGLANLLVRQGRISEAKEALGAGETLLKKIGNSPELAELLCTKGHTEVAAGDLDPARAALGQAETVVAAIGAAPGSELCREITKLRAALA